MNEVEVVRGKGKALTAAEFYKLAEVPPEIEVKGGQVRKPVSD